MHLLLIMIIAVLALRQPVTEQLQILWQPYCRQQLHLIVSSLINFLLLLHGLSRCRCLTQVVIIHLNVKFGDVSLDNFKLEDPVTCRALVRVHSYQSLKHFV